MSLVEKLLPKPTRRIFAVAIVAFALDQLTKWLVLRRFAEGEELVVIPGFFNLTLRFNTGAAWSMFSGNNAVLTLVALVALVALYLVRHHFGVHRLLGQFAFGLIFGGIAGNLLDRLLPSRHAVVDFLHFYLARRGAMETWSFPAFNIADSAICVGVGIIFILNWKNEPAPKPAN